MQVKINEFKNDADLICLKIGGLVRNLGYG